MISDERARLLDGATGCGRPGRGLRPLGGACRSVGVRPAVVIGLVLMVFTLGACGATETGDATSRDATAGGSGDAGVDGDAGADGGSGADGDAGAGGDDEDNGAAGSPTTESGGSTGIQPGDCLDLDVGEFDPVGQFVVAVPCDEQHNAQVFAILDPDDLRRDDAQTTCGFRAPRHVPIADLPRNHEVIALAPTFGERQYLCTVYSPTGLRGSVLLT
ncbi:MAG: hypothetical protein AAGA93_06560 [Actinomycetota bacterium]